MSPSVENSKLSYILSVKLGRVGQNIALHASPTARNVFMRACVRAGGSGDGARVYLCVYAGVFAYIYMVVNFPTRKPPKNTAEHYPSGSPIDTPTPVCPNESV